MDPNVDEELRAQFTIGVEEEYQLVAPGTGELRSRGGMVLLADLTGEVTPEVKDTMVEVGTPICHDAAELAARLRERRFQASAAAAAEDLEILAAGTHPFSDWQQQTLTDASRPRMLTRFYRHLLRQQSIWGMHIHVAIPGRFDRAALMNTVRTFGPHLLALSCSSPFTLGIDTGFASFRTVSWRGFPFVGAPPHFSSMAEFDDYLGLLIRSGTIPDNRTVYWSVRPSARYPTLELRVCDVCPRIGDAVSIAALGRAIVVGTALGELAPLASSLSASLQDEVLRENEWITARDGLDAMLIAPELPEGNRPVRAAIEELIDRLLPIARRLGDEEAVKGVSRILAGGNAADRMREQAIRLGDMPALVEWLVEETRAGTGIDRRSARRDRRPESEALSPPPV